jgi:tetratricopeptide (TPR) repeat protein
MRLICVICGFLLIVSLAAFGSGRCALAAAPKPQEQPTLAQLEDAYAEVSRSIADLLWAKTEDYWHRGRYDDVIAICYRIVDLDPAFEDVYLSAAWLIWSKKTPQAYKEAAALYERGISANPDSWEIPYECGAFFYLWHMRLAKKMTPPQAAKAAVPYLRRAARLVDRGNASKEDRVKVWRAFGHALRTAGQRDAAIRVFKRVLEINPTDPVADRELRKLQQ